MRNACTLCIFTHSARSVDKRGTGTYHMHTKAFASATQIAPVIIPLVQADICMAAAPRAVQALISQRYSMRVFFFNQALGLHHSFCLLTSVFRMGCVGRGIPIGPCTQHPFGFVRYISARGCNTLMLLPRGRFAHAGHAVQTPGGSGGPQGTYHLTASTRLA